jgi:hypothetical protein
MGVTYKLAKNYTLHLSAVVLALSIVGLLVSWGPGLFFQLAGAPLPRDVLKTLAEGWGLWVLFLGFLGLIIGGWYVGEQVYKRRKFEKLIGTDKRSDFVAARKELEDLAKRLPDRYKPRIAEKEGQFKLSKRA